MSTRRTVRRLLALLIAALVLVYGFVWADNWYTRRQAQKQRETELREAGGGDPGAAVPGEARPSPGTATTDPTAGASE